MKKVKIFLDKLETVLLEAALGGLALTAIIASGLARATIGSQTSNILFSITFWTFAIDIGLWLLFLAAIAINVKIH